MDGPPGRRSGARRSGLSLLDDRGLSIAGQEWERAPATPAMGLWALLRNQGKWLDRHGASATTLVSLDSGAAGCQALGTLTDDEQQANS